MKNIDIVIFLVIAPIALICSIFLIVIFLKNKELRKSP